MIAVVLAAFSPGALPEVAGMSLPLRSLLAFQSAGATELGVMGDAADTWLRILRADERVTAPLTVARVLPQEPHVVVDGSVAIDVRTARALLACEGVLFVDGRIVAVHRARDDGGDPGETGETGETGDPLRDGGEGAIVAVADLGVRVPVTDAASARSAEDALLASLRKTQDGIVARSLNRPLSLAITRILCRTSLRPNVLSVAILGVGLVGAALASRGTWGSMAIGGVLFQTQSVLDGCDGELSRLTYRGSLTGEWLDTVGDDLTNYSFFAGCAAGLAASMGRAPVVLGAVGVAAGVLTSGIAYRYLARIGSGDLLKYPLVPGQSAGGVAQGRPGGGFLDAVRPLFKRDFFVFATMLAVIAGRWPALVMLGCFAVGACVTLAAVLHSEWRRRGVAPGAERAQ